MKEAPISAKPAREQIVFKEALVGLELSDADQSLIHYVKMFNQYYRFKTLSFLHVVPKYGLVDPLQEKYDVNPFVMKTAGKDKILDLIDKIVQKKFSREDIILKYFVSTGSPTEELVKIANEREVDLVIMGKRPDASRHAIQARNIIRSVKADVLMVPELSRHTISKIMVPIDFSENSIRALQIALLIKKSIGIDHKIYVINMYRLPDIMPYELMKSREEFNTSIAANHREGFEKFIEKEFPDQKSNIKPILLSTMHDFGEEIISNAVNNKIDLLIVGSKGHSQISRLVLGSTAESILSENHRISTLIVK